MELDYPHPIQPMQLYGNVFGTPMHPLWEQFVLDLLPYVPASLRHDTGLQYAPGGFASHIHSETMGWHPDTVTVMLYLTNGGNVNIDGVSIPIYPGKVVTVDAATPHSSEPFTEGERIVLLTTGLIQ